MARKKSKKAVKTAPPTVTTSPTPVYEPGKIYQIERPDLNTGEMVMVPMRRGGNGGWLEVDKERLRIKRSRRAPFVRIKKIPELEILLADILSEEKNGVSAAKLILAALRKKAINGDTRAAELLMDRAWGKAKQEINVNKTERQFIVIGTQKIEF